jgi:putative hemolysin
MNAIVTEIFIIFLLITANGVFAMAEMALVSVRKARVRKLAEHGDARADAVLELLETPNRFLSTVQVGITLVGILAGAFGGATLSYAIAEALRSLGMTAAYSGAIGIVVVVLGITFLSVVVGEVVPKRVALSNPLGVALTLARFMRRISKIASPAIRVIGAASDLMLKMLGLTTGTEQPVSEDEVRALLEQGQRAGVFFKTEREIVERSLTLDTFRVVDIMTPRARIVWLNGADADEVNWRKIVASGHSIFPVYGQHRDDVLGLVSVKSLWANLALAGAAPLKDLVTEPLIVPESMSALKLLESFKQTRKHVALVTDEFGTVQGLVTLVDVFQELVGDIPADDRPRLSHIVRREDGSWLVDAVVDVDEVKSLLSLKELPGENEEDFQTLGGFILAQFQRIPHEGEFFTACDFRFEIADMDRHRVDKVLIQRAPPPPTASGAPAETAG